MFVCVCVCVVGWCVCVCVYIVCVCVVGVCVCVCVYVCDVFCFLSASMGESEGKAVGQWFGPNTIAQVLK